MNIIDSAVVVPTSIVATPCIDASYTTTITGITSLNITGTGADTLTQSIITSTEMCDVYTY